MLKDKIYHPYIGLTLYDTEGDLNDMELRKHKKATYDFFSRRVPASSIISFYDKSIRHEGFDVIFYSSPWGFHGWNVCPFLNGLRSLLFYVPYYIPSTFDPDVGMAQPFHRLLFRHYLINKTLEDNYLECVKKSGKTYAGQTKIVGHPMLDQISQNKSLGETIIYAPHWSLIHPNCPNDLRMSTFLENGEVILNYAKSHPEQKWAFKPHPTLKSALQSVWSVKRIGSYYAEWATFAEVSYDGDYTKLFDHSRLMITDCDSFLTEYGVTGKPIIFPIGIGRLDAESTFKDLFNSYSQTNNNDELIKAFKIVIEEKQDPKRNERLAALKSSGILNEESSAKRILSDIKKILNIH